MTRVVRPMPRPAVPCAALLCVLVVLVAAAPAQGAATMTSPANGATVRLDRYARPSFAWSLPPGEVNPQVMVAAAGKAGNPPSFDPDTFAPFEASCTTPSDRNGDFQRANACLAEGRLLATGRYDVFIWTLAPTGDDRNPYQSRYSPFTTFVVPPFLTWGNNDPTDPGPGIETSLNRQFGGAGPYVSSTCSAIGWLNEPGAPVTFTFAIKRGHRVLKRRRQTRRVAAGATGGDTVESYILLRPKRGLRARSPLTCSIGIRGGGITLTRTVRMRAP